MKITEIYKEVKKTDPEVLISDIQLVLDTYLAASNIAFINPSTRSKIVKACLTDHQRKDGKYDLEFLETSVESQLVSMGFRLREKRIVSRMWGQ